GVGLNKFTSAITGTSMATNTARLTSPVDATPAEAAKTIAAGTIVINDRSIGTINGATPKNGLAMGKAYNAVNAINDATAGVNARLTTLVAGSAITAFGAAESANFTINGVSVSYTSAGTGATDDATNIVQAINTAITNYNSPAAPTLAPQPQLSLEAVVGDGYNGGAVNSIVLRNTNAGDESRIIIGDVDPTDAAEVKLGLTNSTYNADLTHNTGEITLFSDEPFTIEAGTDDTILSQLGLGGGNQTTTSFAGSATSASTAVNSANFNLNNIPVTVNIAALDSAMVVAQKTRDAINIQEPLTGVTASINSKGGIVFTNSTTGDNSPIVVDSFTAAGVDGNIYGFTNFTAHSGGVAGDTTSDDGSFTYSYDDGGVTAGLQGFKYFNELETDGGSFDIWLYNSDGTLALPQAITVDLERAYDLYDVANAIENSIKNASSEASSWIKASVVDNRLQLNPDTSHHFAFANDTSNILQVAGLNTLFTGHSAGTIGINDAIANDLSMITAATVGANGQIFKGDNTNALKITNIQQQDDISFTGSTADSLEGFYNSLVGEIGNAGRSVNRDLEFNTLVENQMQEMRDSTSGVSLDEEMANLVKYQHAYSAAARLITMSDEMLKSLLDSIR
ncbi:MAG: hypothetical protein OEY01_04600, partial [Desulfobulbaceae bacterium]|nr:hypothetical protein [Desulfobulbaceae bacterium]HIJ78458.1 hypothetical protein [Deltaproteobacteria bacterium]